MMSNNRDVVHFYYTPSNLTEITTVDVHCTCLPFTDILYNPV